MSSTGSYGVREFCAGASPVQRRERQRLPRGPPLSTHSFLLSFGYGSRQPGILYDFSFHVQDLKLGLHETVTSAPRFIILPVWNVCVITRWSFSCLFSDVFGGPAWSLVRGVYCLNIKEHLPFPLGDSTGSNLRELFQMQQHVPRDSFDMAFPPPYLPSSWESCSREWLTGRSRCRSHLQGGAAVKSL